MKRAIVTCMSSDDYILGVISLYQDIKKYTETPFVLLCSQNICQKWRKLYEKIGITYIIVDEINLPDMYCRSIENTSYDYWKNTFIKLNVFNLVQYDKIIYIDSDIMITKNIEEAFAAKSLAAVDDAVFMKQVSKERRINSGFLVVEPNEQTFRKLVNAIPELVEQNPLIGDQDVIQKVFCRDEKEGFTDLGIQYNANAYLLDSYEKDEFSIIHFISKNKPWNWSWLYFHARVMSYLLRGRIKTYSYTKMYYKKLIKIKRELKKYM